QQAVHGWHRAQVAALVQQIGVDGCWRLVHKALVVQHAKHCGAFVVTERPRLDGWRPTRPWRSRTLTMTSIVGGSRATQRRTCRAFANDWCQIAHGLINHHFGSPPLDSAPPVASCSSSAESFPCTSITLRALARSDCKRTFSRRS